MWRKILFSILLMGLFVPSVSAQDKSYSAERFDVDVLVQEDGSLLVTETVVFRFVGEPFTFVFRELPTDRTDGITDIRAGVDGATWPRGEAPGQVEINGNRTVRVEWHLPPTSNETHTFTLSYRLLGVVQQSDASDLLRYQPLPDDFEYAIDRSTVTFTYPQTAVLDAAPAVLTGEATVETAANRVTFARTNIAPDGTLVVELPFAAGSLISAPPQWQVQQAQQQAQQRALMPLWIGVALTILAVGLGTLATAWRRIDKPVTKTTIRPYEPPTDLPPAMAGAINGSGAQPAWPNALATLFDLADRGVLQIAEVSEKKWYRGSEFAIQLVERPSDLRPHELGLLEMLFETKKGTTDEVLLSKLSGMISGKQWDKFTQPLEKEMDMAGLTSPKRQQRRRLWIGLGVVLLAGSLALLVVMLAMVGSFSPAMLLPAAATFIVGLAWLGVGSALKPLTDDGVQIADEWQQFYTYLKDVSKGKTAVSRPEMFVKYLPYAASYGLLANWAKRFEKEGGIMLPDYFKVLSATPQESMAAFVAMAGASSNAGGAAAGAAGAAGGGASGAG